MKPEEFVPQYDSSVLEYILNSGPESTLTSIPINPTYCLMPSSARMLASLWVDSPPVVVMAPPIVQAAGSPFSFNHLVPWLKFRDGTVRNAGQLATYWGMPGVPLSGALDEAKLDVATLVEGQ